MPEKIEVGQPIEIYQQIVVVDVYDGVVNIIQ